MQSNIHPVPDEPTEARPVSRKRWLLYALAVLLVIVLLVWILLANTTVLDGLKRAFRYLGSDGDYGSIRFESYGTSTYTLLDTDFAVATQGGVTLFSESSDSLGRIQRSFANPALKANGDRLLIYDIGGTLFAQMNRSGDLLIDETAAGRIYDADLSSKGYSALLYAGEDSHACLDIYHPTGTLLYRRSSNTHYLSCCAVAPDGAYAVAAALGQTDAAFTAALQIFRTDSETEITELSLGNRMVYDLAFVNTNTFCAIAEDGLYFYRTDGTALGEYSFDGGALTGYSFGGSGFVALTLDLYDAGSRHCLTVLNGSGEATATVSLDEAPIHVSAHGSYVSVLTAQTLSVYNRELHRSSALTTAGGYTNAFVRDDGTAVLVSAGAAELYIP